MPIVSLAHEFYTGSFPTDGTWDDAYPPWLRNLARYHFTPLDVARRAASWLSEPTRDDEFRCLVDLGSGAGKFCLVAALLHPTCHWTGLERRGKLHEEALRWRKNFGLSNCRFEQADAAQTALAGYAGAYAFNPFFEHLDGGDRLDDDLELSAGAYRQACDALRQNLDATPPGFRFVSYFCHGREIPPRFERAWEAEDGKLTGWQG